MQKIERHRKNKNVYAYIKPLASICEQLNSNICFYKLIYMLFTKSNILQYKMLLYLHCILTMIDLTCSNDKMNVGLFTSIVYTGKQIFFASIPASTYQNVTWIKVQELELFIISSKRALLIFYITQMLGPWCSNISIYINWSSSTQNVWVCLQSLTLEFCEPKNEIITESTAEL